jgi:hypothetical protein
VVIGAGTSYVLIAGSDGGADQYTGLSLGASTGSLANGMTTVILSSSVGQSGNVTVSMHGADNAFYGANSYLALYQNSTSGADNIEIIVTPEPGTWSLMLGGLAMLVVRQRRRSRG